ncbi:MAG: sensor histidine kinase [Ignavibacteriales bacterium]|nr:MAG: sensor histidine kinase [Ignavibacteriales bacterium]
METDIQSNKLELLGKLAATLSHEIRNPLSVLKLNLHFLKIYSENVDKESYDIILACEVALERITKLMENILEFSRRPLDELEVTSINEIIEQAIVILNPVATKNSILFDKQLGENIMPLSVNRNKILQVILNLLTNAIEASNNGGNIIVKTARSEKNGSAIIRLVVEDFGIGIKESDKENVFKEFYTSKKTGTGIGLSVCKKLLEEHKAEIYFESQYGKGTRFFVDFPELNNR